MRLDLAGRVTIVILAIGVAARVIFIAAYFDLDWEVDAYAHVLHAKSVFAHVPGSLWIPIGIWPKPVFTLLYAGVYQAVPDGIPLLVVTQIGNVALWTGTAWLALVAAIRAGVGRAGIMAIAILAALSYVAFRASVSALTEVSGAFLFALGMALFESRPRLALFVFGCVILARIDAGFCVVWFALAAMFDRPGPWFGEALKRGACFAAPVVVWNGLGFIHTGQPLYVLTGGYAITETGRWGFGAMTHYLTEMLRFDAALTVLFAIGLAAVLIRRSPRLIRVTAFAVVFYLVFMTTVFYAGAFDSGGMLRYLVFSFPGMMLVAGYGVSALPRLSRPIAVAAAFVACVYGLHWLVEDPTWGKHMQLTRAPVTKLREISALLPQDKTIITDRPDILYYLGKDSIYQDRHRLRDGYLCHNPGVYIVAEGWTPTYSGFDFADFAEDEVLADFRDWNGQRFAIYNVTWTRR